MKELVYFAIYAIQIAMTFPDFYSTCARHSARNYLLYFTHHLLDVYLFFGPLFVVTKLEMWWWLAITAAVAISWVLHDNRCIASVLMNRGCLYPDSEWMDSIKNRLGLREVAGDYFHHMWLGAIAGYFLWRLL